MNTHSFSSLIKLTTDDFDQKSKIIDQIINRSGFFSYNYLISLFNFFMILFFNGFNMLCYGPLVMPLRSHFKLTDYQSGLFCSIIFLGMFAGALCIGSFIELLGRRWTIVTSLFTNFLCIMFFITCSKYWEIMVIRILQGYSIGLVVPIYIAIFAENSPIFLRNFLNNSVWFLMLIPMLIICFILLFSFPNLEVDSLMQIHKVYAVILAIMSFISFFTVRDSPRNLLLIGKTAEAVACLEHITNRSFEEKLKLRLITEVALGKVPEHESDIMEMFSKRYLARSILQFLLWFGAAGFCFGNNLILSDTLKMLQVETKNIDAKHIIFNNLYNYLFFMAANLFSGIPVEFKEIGKKYTFKGTSFLGALVLVFAMIFNEHYAFLFNISTFFSAITYNILGIYTAENYPNRLRVKMLSIFSATSSFSAFVFQLLGSVLIKEYIFAPYICTIFLYALVFVVSFFLSIDKHEQHLDESSEFEEDNINYV